MSVPRIVIRVDSGAVIGSGHVSRCLALAEALRHRRAEVLFVSRDHRGNAADRIQAAGFNLCRLAAPNVAAVAGQYASWVGADLETDAAESARLADKFKADWVVVDHYGIDHHWEQTVRQSCGSLLAIEDFPQRNHLCEIVVNQNLQVGKQNSKIDLYKKAGATLELVGARYALISAEYRNARSVVFRSPGDAVRVLVSFGSCVPAGLMESVIRSLMVRGLEDLHIDLVVCAESDVSDELRRLVRQRGRCILHGALPSLVGLKLRADLAVGAGGVSMLERASLGLPSLVVATAENQRQPTEAMAERGAILFLGAAERVSDREWAAAILKLRSDPFRMFEMGHVAAGLVDCWGTHRVAAAMLGIGAPSVLLRPADAGDEFLLLDWANDPGVRRNSFSEVAISAEVHRKWFARQLENPLSTIYIASDSTGLPLGQIRLEIGESGSAAMIHISVDPALRGKGVGKSILSAVADRARCLSGVTRLIAEVRHGNLASRNMFLSAGFCEVATTRDDRSMFELRLGASP